MGWTYKIPAKAGRPEQGQGNAGYWTPDFSRDLGKDAKLPQKPDKSGNYNIVNNVSFIYPQIVQ